MQIKLAKFCYENLKEDIPIFKEKGKVMLLGDFNARVGTASEIDEDIGMFVEETSNNNGEKLVSFLTEVDLVSCNGRTFVTTKMDTHLSWPQTKVYNRLHNYLNANVEEVR